MRSDSEVNYAANPYGLPPERRPRRAFSKPLLLTVAGVVLFAGAALGVLTLTGGGVSGPPPMIEADPAPTKVRASDSRGGEDAAAPDRLVYERLSGATRPSVERLLPPPEQPMPRPIVAADPPPPEPAKPPASAAAPPVNMLAAPTAPGANAPPGKPGQQTPPPSQQAGAAPPVKPPGANGKPGQQAAAPPPPPGANGKPGQQAAAAPPPPPPGANGKPGQQAAAAPPPPGAPGANGKPGQQAAAAAPPPPGAPPHAPQLGAPPSSLKAPSAVPAPPPPAAAHPPPPSSGGSGWRIQLASVRSEAEASAEWRRLQARFPGVLGGLSLQVSKADLGDKGVFYRVHGGGVDEVRAKAACDQLKSQNVGCVVVKP